MTSPDPDSDPDTPRLRDAVALLPLLAVFVLMPPVITLFVGGHLFGGMPLIVVYLFGVWLALIVAAALLAQRLARSQAAPPAAPAAASAPPSLPPPASLLAPDEPRPASPPR